MSDSDADAFFRRVMNESKQYEVMVSLLGEDRVRDIEQASDKSIKSFDPEVVNILILAASSLLIYFTSKKNQTVTIKGKDGSKIVLPINTPEEDIERFLSRLSQQIEQPQIIEPSSISQEDWENIKKDFQNKMQR